VREAVEKVVRGEGTTQAESESTDEDEEPPAQKSPRLNPAQQRVNQEVEDKFLSVRRDIFEHIRVGRAAPISKEQYDEIVKHIKTTAASQLREVGFGLNPLLQPGPWAKYRDVARYPAPAEGDAYEADWEIAQRAPAAAAAAASVSPAGEQAE
jgi:hypothetical protein